MSGFGQRWKRAVTVSGEIDVDFASHRGISSPQAPGIVREPLDSHGRPIFGRAMTWLPMGEEGWQA